MAWIPVSGTIVLMYNNIIEYNTILLTAVYNIEPKKDHRR